MELFKETHIDFLSRRKICYLISIGIILIGFISLWIKGGPLWGIDFAGGTVIHLKFSKPVEIEEIRRALASIGLAGSSIQKVIGTENEYIIRTKKESKESNEGGITSEIKEALQAKFPTNSTEILKSETIGAAVSKEFIRNSIYAVLFSFFSMIAYLSWRYEFRYAVAGVLALIHDVLITLTFLSLFNKEITLLVVAAILTIIGYSINDTIVIYDRIRENIKLRRQLDFSSNINLSINQTLSRTILTAFTVFIVTLVLFLAGGEVIHDFAFCLLIGVITGTYSSIYIASSIVLDWYNWQKKKR